MIQQKINIQKLIAFWCGSDNQLENMKIKIIQNSTKIYKLSKNKFIE